MRRRITIILCVAMLLQLSIGAALGLAEDAGDSMAQPELVSIMAATLSPGNVVGTTSATITGHVYGSLVVNITEAEIVTPYVGDPPPTAGDNLITGYESGADINAGVAAGNCLQVYAVDMEDQARIVGFYQAELTEADIKEVDMEEVPVEDRMMLDMAPMSGEPVIITTDNGAINNDGIYKLSADFTGEISIGTAATSVTIIGNGFGTQHIDTYINVASGRSSALTLTIVDLNIQAPVDKPGIDFSSAGNYAHVLDISGSSKAAGDTDYAGIQVPAGVSLTITSTSNGSLEAVGGQNGAGIGGGKNGPGGNITISGGIVTAQGGSGSYLSYGAGIGGGGSESGIGGSGGTITISGGTVTAQGQYAAGVGGGGSQSEGQGGSGGAITITNYPTVIASNGGSTGLADIGNGYKANLAGTTTIKNGSGTDLTYIRLQVGNLSSATGNKITVNGQEYEINNAGRTGFFVDKPTSSLDITLNLAGYDPVTINSNPGDVQNQKIYMNYGINIKYEAATGGTVSRASETPASITGVAQGSTATADTGYSFKNWTKDGVQVSTDEHFTPAKQNGLNVAATYIANFMENYTITYHLDGGINGANPTNYNENTPTIALLPASKTGYKFTGWFDAPTGGTQVMEIANGSTGYKTLYARWTEIDYTTDYEIIGDPTHYTLSENVLTIGTGANGNTITVKGTMNGSTLAIADGVTNLTLKLNGVEITSTSKSPIDLQGNSKVTVEVAGGTTNILDASGAANKAGLHVPVNASLTITGTGSLEVTGGQFAAGIGSGDLAVRSGTITINDGTITSTGGAGGAGIGGGKNSSSGAITINGGTVTATAPIGAAGIGGGNSSESTYITITGGTVIAMGTTGSAAIGGGWQANGGTIIITGGTINAIGGNGIGSGYQSTTGSKITIDQSADVTIVSDFNNFAINGDSTGMVINAKLDAAISTSERFLEMDSRILRLPASTKCFAFSAATASKIFVYSDKLCLNLIGRIVTDSGQPEIPVTNLGVDPTNVTPVKFQTLLSDSNVVISAVNPSYEYIGSPLIPEPTVIFGYTTLVKDTDYTLNYSDNSNMGTAKITITFIGKYYGTVEKTFTITRANLTATVEDYSRSYGEANPEFVVTVTGFKNGETASTASGYNAPTASTTATAATGVGTAEISISGGAATNYIFNTADTGTLTITPKALTAIAVADNKTYDGTAAASGTINLTGIVGADDVTANGSFSFADADAGNGKTVHVTGITLAGTAAGNYTVNTSATSTADIEKANITGITFNNLTQTFDGTPREIYISGTLPSGASVSYTDNTHTNAGTYNATANISGGTNFNNKTLNATLTIDKVNLTATVQDYSRTYGEENPVFAVEVSGFVNGEAASSALGYSAPTASTTATAATGVGTAEISITGGTADNYTFDTSDRGNLTITPKALTVIAAADDKTYDGTSAATGTISLSGVVGADDVTANGSFSFADADAGNGKTVHVTGITLAGAAAGNYRVDASTTTTADITPKILTPTARADDKVHDGTTSASGTITFSGIIGSGDVFASGTFAFEDAQVGTDKVVNVTGISLGGAQAGNYSLSTTTVTATADITKSTNADLSGLLVSGGLILSPAFSAAETNYSGNVSHNTSSIVITPTTAHSAATIRINGDIMTGASSTVLLNVGNNTIIIEVTAQDGVTKKTYSLNIIRGNASSNNSSGGSSGDITPSTSATPAQPDNNGIDILVNGKTETAATATTSQEGDRTVTNVIVDDNKVEERLEQGGNHAVVTIPVNNGADVVIGTLNGQTVKNMEMTESVLKITTDQVTYTLPASQINIDAVSQQIGREVELKDIAVSVRISEPPAETVKIVADTANQNNYQIVVPPIEFAITCSSGNKTVGVTKFNAYVERLVAIPEGIDPSRITTGVIVNSEGTFSHVPTVITVIDGKYYAKINSLTNSTYSVIYSPKVFKDVETHWARDAINDMASRLVVSGVGQDTFEPGRDITRAEFAAIVVRGLGLMRPGVGQDNFDDVIQKNWYYDAVTIAGENGIISGYGYGKFGPDDQITREQAMAMIARAMQVTKLEANLTDSETNKVLAGFTDANRAADYAKPGIAACVKTGLISGRNPNTLAPKDNITRAEVAVIVQRLLQRSGLI